MRGGCGFEMISINTGKIQGWLNDFNRRTIIFFRIWAWLESVYIRALDFKKRPPLLIYQMGKVGSTSVYKSLKQAKTRYPIFHIHWFSKQGLATADKLNSEIKDPVFDMHLKRCRQLRTHFDEGKINKCKIITLAREPIARTISSIFQDIQLLYPQLINDDGSVRFNSIRGEVQKQIELKTNDVRFCLNWFDEEFKAALEVDIYDFPFDQTKGYQILATDRFDILILTLEQLSNNFQEAIGAFLGLTIRGSILKSNTRDKTKYRLTHQRLRKKLNLSLNACYDIYTQKYVRHFYSDAHILDFISRWAKPNQL